MHTTIDAAGRIVVPKQLREALGLTPGTVLDISWYGAGLHIVPSGRTARLVEEDGHLVIDGTTRINDDIVYALVDSVRR
jgi:AbrB family looped-hinge helix DNA binding protein